MFGFHRKQKTKQTPPLVKEAGEQVSRFKTIETLKAGKLASLALELTDAMIKKNGPRIAGSPSCLSAAKDLDEALTPFCTRTLLDDFHFHPEAYYRPLRMLPLAYLLSLGLLWGGMPVTSTLFLFLYLFWFLRECFWYKPFAEKWGVPQKGRNVTGVIEPDGTVERTIIFSGHHDSAPLTKWHQADKASYIRHVLVPYGLGVLLALESVVQLLTELFTGKIPALGLPPVSSILFLVVLTVGCPLVFGLRKFITKEGSPGAGDNLVSSAMTVELARYFDWKKRCGTPLKHTRLLFVSFDGEEAGLRGSRKWFGSHKDLLVSPMMLNYDCPYYADEIKFLEKDINGTQGLSSSFAHRMVRLSKEMGYDAGEMPIPVLSGGTDAASGARAGVEACTLTAVAWGDRRHPEVYHTEDDTVASIEKDAIERAVTIGIKLAETVDSGRFFQDEASMMEDDDETEAEELPQLSFKKV